MFSIMKPITFLIVALCFQPGFGVGFVHHCQSMAMLEWNGSYHGLRILVGTLWTIRAGMHWTSVLDSGWTCSSVITWSRILFLGPHLNSALGKWLIPLIDEREAARKKSKELEKTVNVSSLLMTAENSKWLDIQLCGPQTPASRVNLLVKHGTGN